MPLQGHGTPTNKCEKYNVSVASQIWINLILSSKTVAVIFKS